MLLSGGKKGDIAVIDLRQRQVVASFQAHERSVRALSIVNGKLLSGSVDEDVKCWELSDLLALESGKINSATSMLKYERKVKRSSTSSVVRIFSSEHETFIVDASSIHKIKL